MSVLPNFLSNNRRCLVNELSSQTDIYKTEILLFFAEPKSINGLYSQ